MLPYDYVYVALKILFGQQENTAYFSGLEVPELFQSVDSDRKFLSGRPCSFLYICPFYIDETVYRFVVNHGAFHVHGMSLIPNPVSIM